VLDCWVIDEGQASQARLVIGTGNTYHDLPKGIQEQIAYSWRIRETRGSSIDLLSGKGWAYLEKLR